MGEYLVVEGAKPYDGRYPLDLGDAPFTVREWGWLKRLSGYLPLTAADGFEGNDPELMLAIALVLMRREGKVEADDLVDTYGRLADRSGVRLRWESDGVVEGDTPEDPTESSSESTSSHGPDSTMSSESSADDPRRIGMPDSAISRSVPSTLGS